MGPSSLQTQAVPSGRGVGMLLMCSSCCCPQIREQNLQDIKTAGPQSQVLCGVVMDRSLVQVRTGN